MSEKSFELVDSELLSKLKSNPNSIPVLRESLRKKTLGPDGESEHPLFAWRPGCPPYETDSWHRPGKLYFQEGMLTCDAFMIGVCTANGVGKTETGARLVAARARGEDPLTGRKWDGPQLIWVLGEPDLVPDLFGMVLKYSLEDELERVHHSRGHQYAEWKNGSRVVMKSTGMDRKQFQMGNVNAIWVDEESPSHIWNECMMRLRKDDSQIYLTFTPVGGTQFMYDTLRMGERSKYENAMDGDLALFFASMDDSPFLPQDFLERAKEQCSLDEDEFRIRVMGDYRLMGGRVIFNEDVLRGVHDGVCEPEFYQTFTEDGDPVTAESDNGTWAIWSEPIPGHSYVIGCDLSEGGVSGDYTAGFVLDVTNGEIAARFHGKVEPGEFARELMYMGHHYYTAVINWEMNMQGAAIWHVVKEFSYPRVYRRESMSGKVRTMMQTVGFRTDRFSKPAIISALRGAFCDGSLVLRDRLTVDELTHFAHLKKGSSPASRMGMGALSGYHDDLVMALAITWKTASQASETTMPVMRKSIGEMILDEALDWASKKKGRSSRRSRRV